jgi:hypothetical protein
LQELRIDRLSLDGDGALLIKGCTYLVRCGRVRPDLLFATSLCPLR